MVDPTDECDADRIFVQSEGDHVTIVSSAGETSDTSTCKTKGYSGNIELDKHVHIHGKIRIEITRYKEGKGWINPPANEAHDQMVALQQIPTPEGTQPLKPDDICEAVLGRRSNQVKGLGWGPKPKSRKVSSSSDACSLRREHELSTALSETQEKLHVTKEELHVTQDKLSATQEKLSVTQDKLSATQEKLSATQDKLSAMQEKLSVTQYKLSAMQEKLSVTQDKLSVMQEQLSRMQERLSAMENRTMTDELASLRDLINKLMQSQGGPSN